MGVTRQTPPPKRFQVTQHTGTTAKRTLGRKILIFLNLKAEAAIILEPPTLEGILILTARLHSPDRRQTQILTPSSTEGTPTTLQTPPGPHPTINHRWTIEAPRPVVEDIITGGDLVRAAIEAATAGTAAEDATTVDG